MKNFIIAFLFFILAQNKTEGVPYRWSGGINASRFDPYHPDKFPEGTQSHRKILTKAGYGVANNRDVGSRTDGKIVFPTDEPSGQLPQHNLSHVPVCENATYCENVPNYPDSFVENALRDKDLTFLTGADKVPEVVHRLNIQPEDIPLCQVQEKVVYPKVAQNSEKEWLFVVNHGDLTQGVRVEICGNENGECDVIDGAINGYSSTCKQKYIYRQLVAVNRNGHVKPDMFRFPSSCCCHIKMDGNTLLRFGSSKKNDSPVSTD